MAKNMNRHGLVNKTFKTQTTADNRLAIQEESLSPNAQNDLDKISAELESLFKQQGYSVEVDQYKNIKGLGFYMTVSKKKNYPGLCVISVFYSDDLNKFSVSYRRSVKFFESPEEVIRYVRGLHIVCESMSRRINEDVNSPDYYKDGFDTRFRYMDGVLKSCSDQLNSFLDSLGDSLIKYRLDRDKNGNPDLIRLAAKSDVKTWFKILDFLLENDCYIDKNESRRSAVKLRINERGIKRSTGKSNSVASFLDKQIESGKIDEKQVTVVYDKNNNIMWLGKAGFYPLLMSNVEYRSSGYDKDHPHEFWINARSYTEPFEENYKKQLMINESPMDYLDSETRATIDTLERLGYRGTKPMMFDGKPMAYYSKSYFTDRRTSSGVTIYVDPFDGSIEVQEFVNDIDTEDLTDICPVKLVHNSNDILKIDKWAKQIKKSSYGHVNEDAFDDDWDNFTRDNPDWESDFYAIFDEPWYGYLFHSTMTDDKFAVISKKKQAVFDYGKKLVNILRNSLDDPYATERFIDELPDYVILTNPEHDDIRFDRSQGERGMWCVDMDGGWGDTIVFNLIGDFKDRF